MSQVPEHNFRNIGIIMKPSTLPPKPPVGFAPPQAVVEPDSPTHDNDEKFEDVMDNSDTWWVKAYTTELPTLPADKIAEAERIAAEIESGM